MQKPRVPKGVPTGGEFAATGHAESDISLDSHEPTADGTTVRSIELEYAEGSSSKFYRTFVTGDDNEGHAVVQYGRIGTAGTTKATSYPSLAEAEAFAAKQVKAKKAKGYQPTAEAEFDIDGADLGSLAAMDLDGQFMRHREAGGTIAADATADEVAAHAAATERAAALAAESDYTPTATQADVTRALEKAGFAKLTDPAPPPVPQLAETISKLELARALDDPGWTTQRKVDGDRFMVQIEDGNIRILNRSGQPKVTNVPAAVVASFAPFKDGNWNFDGEIVGRTFHAFDMAHADGFVDACTSFGERHAILSSVVNTLDSPHVRLVDTAGSDAGAKRKMLRDVKESDGEGIILRRTNTPYEHGTRGAGLMKHKFVSEADVYVKAVDPSKESVTLAVRNAAGEEMVVGKASTIGKGPIAKGDVVEARFAHVLDPENPTMVQPRILRKRSDKAADECHLDQFAEAGTVKDVPAEG